MASVDLPMEIPQTGPISLSGGGAEQEGHWPIPEGVVLASMPKRVGAWMLDMIFVMGVLLLLTTLVGGGGANILRAFDYSLPFEGGRSAALFGVNWFLILTGHFLYFRHTGMRFSRSLGQRWFGLAVVREDGEVLSSSGWDGRALMKLRYLIPLLGQFWFGPRDVLLAHRRHTHQSSVDLKVASIVAVADSLPPACRAHIR